MHMEPCVAWTKSERRTFRPGSYLESPQNLFEATRTHTHPTRTSKDPLDWPFLLRDGHKITPIYKGGVLPPHVR